MLAPGVLLGVLLVPGMVAAWRYRHANAMLA